MCPLSSTTLPQFDKTADSAGLVGLGLEVCKDLYKYIGDAEDLDKEVEAV